MAQIMTGKAKTLRPHKRTARPDVAALAPLFFGGGSSTADLSGRVARRHLGHVRGTRGYWPTSVCVQHMFYAASTRVMSVCVREEAVLVSASINAFSLWSGGGKKSFARSFGENMQDQKIF